MRRRVWVALERRRRHERWRVKLDNQHRREGEPYGCEMTLGSKADEFQERGSRERDEGCVGRETCNGFEKFAERLIIDISQVSKSCQRPHDKHTSLTPASVDQISTALLIALNMSSRNLSMLKLSRASRIRSASSSSSVESSRINVASAVRVRPRASAERVTSCRIARVRASWGI
jgi:hypothetical protein